MKINFTCSELLWNLGERGSLLPDNKISLLIIRFSFAASKS